MPSYILVDDLIFQGAVLSKLFQQAGLKYEYGGQAVNGEKGILLVREKHPDIVFTDIEMPDMDGLTMAAQVRREFPQTKIVFLSAHDDFRYVQQAVRLKADDYLLKPVNRSKLLALMERLAEQDREVCPVPDAKDGAVCSVTDGKDLPYTGVKSDDFGKFGRPVQDDLTISLQDSVKDPLPAPVRDPDITQGKHSDAQYSNGLYALRQELITLINADDFEAVTTLMHETYELEILENRMSEPVAIRNISKLVLLVTQELEPTVSSPESIHVLYEHYVSRHDDGKLDSCIQDFASFIHGCIRVCSGRTGHTTCEHVTIVKNYIKTNLDQNLTLENIAAQVFLSPSHLSRIFRKYENTTISEYIREKRMKRACYLLISTDETIESIGVSCGYPKANTFWKIFKKEVGMSPGDYRSQNLQLAAGK